MDTNENELFNATEMSQEMQVSHESSSDTGLKAGINYCKYLSRQMQNEMTAWEEKLDSIRQINKKLKQNVIDLDTEKQNMVMKFQEEFRKYDVLNACVNKLDEKIETVKNFLEKMVGLEEDIRHSENEDQRILNLILNTLEEYAGQFQNIEYNFVAEKEAIKKRCEEMNRKIEENQIYEKINLDLKTYVTICEKKIRDKMPPVNFSETLETIKERICKEKMDADTVVAEFKQKTAGLWLQTKQEIDLLRLQVCLMKKRAQNERAKVTAAQEEIKLKFENLKFTYDDLICTSTNRESIIENLKQDKEEKQIALKDWMDRCSIINENVKSKSNVVNESITMIQRMEYKQQELLKQNEKIKEDIKEAKAKREQLKKILNESKEFNSLKEKCEGLKQKRLSLTDKGHSLDKMLEELSCKNDQLIQEMNIVKDHIQKEDQLVNDMKTSTEENNDYDVFETTEDSELLETQLGVEVEENSLNELYESEIDSLYEKLYDIIFKFTDSETELSRIKRENLTLKDEIIGQRKSLKILKEENEFCNNSIQRIKQNVYQGHYVTMQELNKKLNTMVNGKNVEMERVAKLTNEIMNLEDLLNPKTEIPKSDDNNEMSAKQIQLTKRSKRTKKVDSVNAVDDIRPPKK